MDEDGIDPREAEMLAFIADSPYPQGGLIPSGRVMVTIDPDECIIRPADVAAGRWVCGRSGHPTPTSDCTTGRFA